MTNELWKEMSAQSYQPRVNDYVRWKGCEGWIYWIDSDRKSYLTIEISIQPKSEQSYKDCSIHRNYRCLLCCYQEDWKDLVYVRSR